MFPVFVIFIFLLFGTILFCSFYFGARQTMVRSLSKIKRRSVASLKSNELVKVYGKALHVEEPLIAPLSKRQCIFYTVKIEKRVSRGKTSHWKTIVEDQKIQNFFLEQQGSFVIVKPTQVPKNYKSYLMVDKRTSSGTFNKPTPEFQAVLDTYNISSENFFGFNKRLRYKEGIIEIGEHITVSGIAKWKSLKATIEGYNYSKIVALESNENQKLLITDLPEVSR